MTKDGPTAPTLRGLLWQRLQEVAPFGVTLATGILAVGGFFVEVLDFPTKIGLSLFVGGLALLGILGIRWRARREITQAARADKAEAEVSRLRIKLEKSAPKKVLETVGTALFVRPGGWRLTLLVVEQLADQSWCLKPVVTIASSEVFEASPHGQISLTVGPLREIFDVDATDPLHPFSNESSNLPNRDVEPDEWRRLHSQIIPGTPNVLGMPTRKFGWTVLQEPASRRTLVLLSESVLPDGIRLDVVRSQLLAPTIALISRLAGVSALPQETSD